MAERLFVEAEAFIDAERGELRTLSLPSPSRSRGGRSGGHESVFHVYWSGKPWQLGSAAYWEQIASTASPPEHYRLGETLPEEVGACLLGGYGMPYELAAAAHERLRDEGVYVPSRFVSAQDIEALLRVPLTVGTSVRRYRFPRQRALRIQTAMRHLVEVPDQTGDTELRDWLLDIPGIGPKTASWIVRNHRSSSEVAILDIHLVRAGIAAGVFSPAWRLQSDYDVFERAFLGWAAHAGIDGALLDACIWGTLVRLGDKARDLLGVSSLGMTPSAVWPV